MKRLIVMLIFSFIGNANIKSTTNEIGFDVNSDGERELILNETGLGVGVTPSTNLQVKGNAIISEQIFIGTSAGQSNLNVAGTLGMGFLSISSNTSLDSSSIVFADSSSDNITLTLPYAGNVTGRVYQIKKVTTLNSVWINGGGNLIDDQNPIELYSTTSFPSLKVMSDGTQWRILEEMFVPITLAADNLIAWWKLDETTGATASDSSGSGIDLTIVGSASFSGNSTYSIFNRSLTLDGSNDALQASESPIAAESNINRGTLSAWIKTSDAGSGYRGIIVKHRAYGMFLNNNNLNVWDWSASTGRDSGVALNDGEYHHVVVTFDSGVVSGSSFYIDGGYVSSFDMTVSNHNEGLSIGAGNNPASNQEFGGIIDDARVYDKILSRHEIKALYQVGLD